MLVARLRRVIKEDEEGEFISMCLGHVTALVPCALEEEEEFGSSGDWSRGHLIAMRLGRVDTQGGGGGVCYQR